MVIDFGTKLKVLSGEVMTEPVQVRVSDEEAKDGYRIELQEKPVLLGDVVANALIAPLASVSSFEEVGEEKELDKEIKVMRFDLSVKVSTNMPVEVDAKEIVCMIDAVNESKAGLLPLVFGQVSNILNGKYTGLESRGIQEAKSSLAVSEKFKQCEEAKRENKIPVGIALPDENAGAPIQ